MTDLVFWHWLALALLFWGAEMLLPGVAMLWMGAAAALVGVLLFFLPALDPNLQLVAFSAIALVALALTLGRRISRKHEHTTASAAPNRGAARYIGQTLTLEEAIVNGHGRAKLGDSSWAVSGPDLPAGRRVKVVQADGAVLQVEPV